MTIIVGRQPMLTIPISVRHYESKFDRFVTLLVLRLMQSAQCDMRSRKHERVADALRFLHSDHARGMADGIGIDIEWLRSRALCDHYFVELPGTDGYRFRSYAQPVVVRGEIHPIPGSQYYRILAFEPGQFAEDYPAFTSSDWVEVEGPARWLSEDEYVELLAQARVDRRLVAAARRAAKAAR